MHCVSKSPGSMSVVIHWVAPCMQVRAAALTGTQCASYDQAKRLWMQHTGMGDNPGTHLGASMITGLATTTITAPVDLIKTNMFVGVHLDHI